MDAFKNNKNKLIDIVDKKDFYSLMHDSNTINLLVEDAKDTILLKNNIFIMYGVVITAYQSIYDILLLIIEAIQYFYDNSKKLRSVGIKEYIGKLLYYSCDLLKYFYKFPYMSELQYHKNLLGACSNVENSSEEYNIFCTLYNQISKSSIKVKEIDNNKEYIAKLIMNL